MSFGTNIDEKTVQMFLYICSKTKDSEKFGATHLNKTFWFSDSVHYVRHRKPISSLGYIKQNEGPMPKTREFLAIRSHLLATKSVVMEEVPYFGFTQKRLVPIVDYDLSLFSGEEISIIDGIIERVQEMTATELSQWTHEFPAWQAARYMEEIPLFAYVLTSREPSAEEIAIARQHINDYRRTKSNS